MAGEGFTPVRLSDDGRGIAQAEGKVVFVRGALPGETVEAERVAVHRRFDEAELLTVREAAPERVTPPCAHYGECGGCDPASCAGGPARAQGGRAHGGPAPGQDRPCPR